MTDIVTRLRDPTLILQYGDRHIAADEIERLRATLAASCDDERSQLYEANPGGGCGRAIDAEAEVERLRCLTCKCVENNAKVERLRAAAQQARAALSEVLDFQSAAAYLEGRQQVIDEQYKSNRFA